MTRLLEDWEVRALARDAWRRQLLADIELEKKLAATRLSGVWSPSVAPGRTGDLFGGFEEPLSCKPSTG